MINYNFTLVSVDILHSTGNDIIVFLFSTFSNALCFSNKAKVYEGWKRPQNKIKKTNKQKTQAAKKTAGKAPRKVIWFSQG